MHQVKAVHTPRWYAVHTHPKQEDRANNNLRAWKVETFNPKIKRRHPNPYLQVATYVSKPLFPGYIFARFDLDNMLGKVLFTRGVRSVVSFGGLPAEVSDDIITLIQSEVSEKGFVEVGEQLRTGDKVEIQDGPLKSLAGVFERSVKGSNRVLILLAAINYQGSVVVQREHVSRRCASTGGWAI